MYWTKTKVNGIDGELVMNHLYYEKTGKFKGFDNSYVSNENGEKWAALTSGKVISTPSFQAQPEMTTKTLDVLYINIFTRSLSSARKFSVSTEQMSYTSMVALQMTSNPVGYIIGFLIMACCCSAFWFFFCKHLKKEYQKN